MHIYRNDNFHVLSTLSQYPLSNIYSFKEIKT